MNALEMMPTRFDEYVGQESIKESLRLHIEAARRRKRPMDRPVLLTGGSGLGKTSLASAIAGELGDPLKIISMPMKGPDYRTLREHHGVVLFDEIHRLKKEPAQVHELLDLLSTGSFRRSSNGWIIAPTWMSYIAATTDEGDLSLPLRNRFLKLRLEPYTADDMAQIVKAMSDRVDLLIDDDTAAQLGQATGFIPRKAEEFVVTATALRDVGEAVTAEEILRRSRVEPDGLEVEHVALLKLLYEAGGDPVGLKTLTESLQTDQTMILEWDRLLIGRLNLVARSPRGRNLTEAGYHRAHELINRKEDR